MKYFFCNAIVKKILKESTDYALIYYIGLKKLLTINGEIIFTYKLLIEVIKKLGFTISIDSRRINDFINYLYILEKFSLVTVNNNIKDIGINDLIYLHFNLEKEKSLGFSYIDEEDIISLSCHSIKLLNFYCCIVSYVFKPRKDDARPFSQQYKYCFPGLQTFIKHGVVKSASTIKEYNNILEKLNLIRVKKSHYILVRDYPNEDFDILFNNILDKSHKV